MGFIVFTFPGRDLSLILEETRCASPYQRQSCRAPRAKARDSRMPWPREKTSMGVPHILTSKVKMVALNESQIQQNSPNESQYGIKIFLKPHQCGLTDKCIFFKNIIFVANVFLCLCVLDGSPSSSQVPPLRTFSWVKERVWIWLGRPGRPPQHSMPKPLVYNGPVRITAGAWRAAKGTQHSLVCLFYNPLACTVYKVPVGFVWFNSQSDSNGVQYVNSGGTSLAAAQLFRRFVPE